MKWIITLLFITTTFIYAKNNLIWIKESPKRLSWLDAKEYCKINNAKLPSLKEISSVWEENGKTSEIDGFDLSVSYWTSTEVEDNSRAAYPFYFGIGKEGWYYKKDHYGVRCIKN